MKKSAVAKDLDDKLERHISKVNESIKKIEDLESLDKNLKVHGHFNCAIHFLAKKRIHRKKRLIVLFTKRLVVLFNS